MRNYKYHEFIDTWIDAVEKKKVHSCKEQKLLMKFVKKVLKDKNVVIDKDKIYEAVEVVEKYFPFKLEDFQKFFFSFVAGVFYKDTGDIVFDDFFVYMGRGGGKNGLISCTSFYLQSDKHNIKNYDIDIVATSEKQAKTSFEEVYQVIEDIPKLQKLFYRTKEEITYKKTNSTLRYCTSNAKTKDGGRPGAVIFDEVHQYENYDNIKVHIGGLGKVENPRRFSITTDGEVRESVLDDLKEKAKRVLLGEDPHNGFFPFIFKMDNEKEVEDPELWEKSIPRINHNRTLKRTVMKEYNDMHQSSELKVAFLTKRMNLPTQNEAKAVAEWVEIKATNQPIPDLIGQECIGAVDYADLKDFCSVGLLFKKDGKRIFKQHTFIHEKSIKFTKFNIDIKEAVDLGLATIVRGEPIIPPKLIVDWFKEQAISYVIKMVVADRYRYAGLKEAFEAEGIEFHGIPSGYITHNKLHPLITQLFAGGLLIFGDDKLMRWYVNNCYVQTDSKGNKSYHKIEPIKRKTDGFFCFLHAMSKDEELVEVGEFTSYDVITF
ncbi:Phage terminase-like protein, large subunit, contains N-terminal HTH domain [Natronincola peptidivorans]|uniref:Phage terminase-like protein, large subunit, contains N-terminal HTH domain n=1 Tax=Natronincola peptidivorans TaxID=426128 RepID=A0A1I0FCW3_9FIRM|nr:terminase large subunit [Natronincola peptidivorans]SET55774.1 Phage terminase-like protein, large subunit, contains N-terminal HTH domain [Natronincola peptidivorans]